jgi:Flp pilus assembly protein protease CpaA
MAGRDLLVLAAVFISITVASIVIRVFTRLFVLKNMGADDCKLKQIRAKYTAD